MVRDIKIAHSAISELFIFLDLDDDQLIKIAAKFDLLELDGRQTIFNTGERLDYFYFVLDGQVQLSKFKKGLDRNVTVCSSGDFFGDDAIRARGKRRYRAITLGEARILRITRNRFLTIMAAFPKVKEKLMLVSRSRTLVKRYRCTWLGLDEKIIMMARKHHITLWTSCALPVFFFVVSFLLVILFSVLKVTILSIIGLSGSLLSLVWTLWVFLNWVSSIVVVTNYRVVLFQNKTGYRNSRQEAPFSSILSIGIATDQAGRILGYGDVVLNTYAGKITLPKLGLYNHFAGFLTFQLQQKRHTGSQLEKQAMIDTIKDHLGLTADPANSQTRPGSDQKREPSPPKRSILAWFVNLFKIRVEYGNTVTYRKHWFVLLKEAWFILVGFLAIVLFFVANELRVISFLSIDLVIGITGVGCALLGGWFFYKFEDWRNDIFQVTAEHIIDIDRKPFGREEKRSAPLENILSLEHQRVGILGILLNFGDVTATVGTTVLTFEGVYDPASVQLDIFNRMDNRKRQKTQLETQKERSRVAGWIAAYHEEMGELQQDNNSTDPDQNPR